MEDAMMVSPGRHEAMVEELPVMVPQATCRPASDRPRGIVARAFVAACAVAAVLVCIRSAPAQDPPAPFSRENLVAWCIVPFDSTKRGPEERAAMLDRLGFRRFAYD